MKRFVSTLTCTLLLLGSLAVATAPAVVAATGRAVVVIDTGSGSRRAVISFTGTISGIQALQLAGANPATYGYSGQGVAVCSLDGVGHGADDSCLGTPSDPRYWAYFRAPGGAGSWTYARGGAGSTTVSDGDVEGWRFGTGQAPPFASFCVVAGCAPPPTSPPSGEAASGGSSGGSTGGSAAGSTGGSTGGSAGANAAPSGPAAAAVPGAPTLDPRTPEAVSEPVVSTQPESVATTTESANGRRGQALGARVGADSDDGSGSPWGLIVAASVAAAVVIAAVLRRRRRSAM